MPARTRERRRFVIDLPWRSIWRVLVAAALVWCWFRLGWLVLLLLVAIVLAVTLNPLVRRLEARGLPRWAASTLVVGSLVGLIAGFLFIAWSNLAAQAQLVGMRLLDLEQIVLKYLPTQWSEIIARSPERSLQDDLASIALTLMRATANAALVFFLAVILTLYLLIEGHTTYKWLLAFVPLKRRGRVAWTLAECEKVVFSYVAGNVATSIFAATFVLVSLTVLHVPAALLLAVIAGVCDFVPVLGFVASSVPAVLLALTVSPLIAFTVAGLYILYHVIENYFIAPYVYGERLRLSNVVIVLAFAVGAQLGGVAGAVIALPIAAAYPAIERIWLRERLGDEVIEEHAVIEHQSGESSPVSTGSASTRASPSDARRASR